MVPPNLAAQSLGVQERIYPVESESVFIVESKGLEGMASPGPEIDFFFLLEINFRVGDKLGYLSL